MLKLELDDGQDGWVHDTDAKEVYADADLPTEPDGESETGGEDD